ncbi:phosphotransfer protein [Musa troglodytarum]|uniref:Histidine-containing phosphotransfer protein n=1 Tax=Musa troglodytarum TaxID=320322 RepID=A0A9E7GZM3_9LILI|nr:phosphotransfer protein [Musa troglodytarum]
MDINCAVLTPIGKPFEGRRNGALSPHFPLLALFPALRLLSSLVLPFMVGGILVFFTVVLAVKVRSRGRRSRCWRLYIEFASDVFREGFLDNQYTQLLQLQDENEPKFVLQVGTLFLEDSEKLLNQLRGILDKQDVDFEKLDACVRKLTGSSASIGANRLKNVCMPFHNCCKKGSKEGCLKCLQQVAQEYLLVKSKLETLFKLEKQILAAGVSVPVLSLQQQ